jgi:DNA-binding transcriptional LysR family regulator
LIAQLNVCLSGAGLAVLPVFMTGSFLQLQRVLSNQVNLTRTFYMQTHEDSRRIGAIQETAKFIVQQVLANRHMFSPSD